MTSRENHWPARHGETPGGPALTIVTVRGADSRTTAGISRVTIRDRRFAVIQRTHELGVLCGDHSELRRTFVSPMADVVHSLETTRQSPTLLSIETHQPGSARDAMTSPHQRG